MTFSVIDVIIYSLICSHTMSVLHLKSNIHVQNEEAYKVVIAMKQKKQEETNIICITWCTHYVK